MNLKNAYVCSNLHSTVTINTDQGTTPMIIACPQCNERAMSMMYNVNQQLEPSHEWYSPTDEDWKDLKADISSKEVIANMQHHVAKGGLLLRPIKK